MCLVVLAWQAVPDLPLVVAANRDEFHGRPAAPAAFWSDLPGILAGRDLKAGGTWMGVSRSRRFAAVTNYRGATEPSAPSSRGSLVSEFLKDDCLPGQFVGALKSDLYSGFNLLVADENELWWLSNRGGTARRLEPGIYGLGNLLLDSPEVGAARNSFESMARLAPGIEPLMSVVAKAKIVNVQYGTRCSTVLLRGKTVRYAERRFNPDGAEEETRHYEF